MTIKRLPLLLFLWALVLDAPTAAAAVCSVQGKISSIIPSGGDAGIYVLGQTNGCTCDGSDSSRTLLWIDIHTDGGKSLYSAALAARISNLPVTATFIDGQGQGNPNNNSIWLKAWATCHVNNLEL